MHSIISSGLCFAIILWNLYTWADKNRINTLVVIPQHRKFNGW